MAQDTTKTKEETKKYTKIQVYSNKHKFTKFLYKMIFEPVYKPVINTKSFSKIKKLNYAAIEGKIIRNIKINSFDPFGYYLNDSTQTPKNSFLKAGNSLHIKTKKFAIKNLLLIRESQPLDSLLVKESARLIRSQGYVSELLLEAKLVSKDSVDLSIRILDSWSAVPQFDITSNKSTFSLNEKNFFGLGHEFYNSYSKNFIGIHDGFSSSYIIPNFKNTFVKTSFAYSIDFDQNYTKSVSIERPFYSTFTKWAAGFSLSQVYGSQITFTPTQAIELQRYKADFQDYWAGHSVRLFKGNSEFERSTNFFATTRFYNKNFIENPIIINDILGTYANEKLYIASIGIASRKYIQDKYIFNFNIVEDIASGFIYTLTAGFQNKNNINRTYIGGKAALGNLFKFGYLGTNFEYGTYINNGIIEESAAVFKAIYFTNLKEIGTWKFRQFINPEVVIGMNRPNVLSDRITLNGYSGINGFNSQSLFGTKKLLISFQTQGYSPWKVTGFRLNPYFRYTMGLIGDDNRSLFSSKVYSQIGVGVIISNDYLVFKSFQFSFSYYPNLPIDGGSIYKTNAINTSDFGLENFGILKPELVKYQ
ncbi:MAG: hypothetical protein QE264_07845 [Flavobacterium sp.]|jgi:hypothetical protein|nr:hypothetical protein [Flavobacterium sp.]